MSWFKSIRDGIRVSSNKAAVERDMDEELLGFAEASVAEKLRRGMSEEQARRAAQIEIGSQNAVKHHIRSAGWESTMEILWQDLRHSVRGLWRTPGFTLVAVLSLALGIGANTAIFTLIQQVLLHDLPVNHPEQLVTFGPSLGGAILGGVDLGTADMFTYDFAQQLQAEPGPFQGVASYSSFSPVASVRAAANGPALQASVSLVSGNFFHVMGAHAQLGRTVIPSDAVAPDSTPVVVLSHNFWEQSLGADPAILGKTITINATQYGVVGVLPAAFHGVKQEIESPDLWVPITMAQSIYLQPGMLTPRSFYFLNMVARRSPASTLAADQTWLDQQVRNYVRSGESGAISADRQREIGHLDVRLTPGAHGASQLRRQYGALLQILMGVVGVVLLIACANLANFLLARAAARQRETATRLALGSSRSRIVRQSLVEALLLSLAGGALGLALAFAATRTMIAFVAQGAASPSLSPLPDPVVLLFTVCVALCAGLLFGIGPAIGASRASAGPAMNASARTASSAQRNRSWPKLLVTGQIVLSLVLLVGAGLFLRTLRNLEDQDFGFERTHMLIASIDPRPAGYKPEQVPGLNKRLLEQLSTVPGVRSAALSATPPISGGSWRSSFEIPGYTPAPKEDMGTPLNRVSGQYFETTGISLAAGRAIANIDQPNTLRVAVVNQAFARHFFPKGDAVGHTLKIGIDAVEEPRLIVGVAHDTKSGNPRGETERMVYLPLAQMVGKNGEGIGDSFAYTIEVRTIGNPAAAIRDLRNTVTRVDPNLPLLQVRTIQEHLETFMGSEALIARLTLLFAALALVLACIGLCGVMSFNVVRRTNEIGIRIALGAREAGVQWMVLRESLVLLAAGLALGLPIALAAADLVRSQLYQLSPFDPFTMGAAVFVISVVSVLAAWLPARRAAAVDPMVALRCD